ncbi:hypothetical protein ACERZ8_20345 [Tateyamaria armeniaca]|uniref:Uncharacterized protein n=1 Tax=Tateyamaria armeniaca TaxID=2518930 RepID=A0ABW8V409_9RHOB
MRRIGNIDYPNTFYTIVADPALAPVLHEYCQATKLDDNYEYLMAMRQPIDPRKMYRKFISYDGEYPVNVGHNARAIAKKLAEERDWNSPFWYSLFGSIQTELLSLLNAEHVSGKFWAHKVFLDHHVNVNQGNADDAYTVVDDPVVTGRALAARVLGLGDSPLLERAIANFEKEGETLRTWSIFQDYLKGQKSTMRAQDAVKILLANGVLSAPEESVAMNIADTLNTPDIRATEAFYEAFKKVRGDGRALWDLVTEFQATIGKGGTPATFLRRLDREKLLPAHADPLAPGEEEDIPPAPPADEDVEATAQPAADDMPPPPPPSDEDVPPPPPPLDEDEDVPPPPPPLDESDLPPPPAYGQVEDYPDHIAAIEALLPGRDQAKITKAVKTLMAAMAANGECPPGTPVQQIAAEVIRLVKAKRRAAAEADAFPEPAADADPLPRPTADPFPDDVEPQEEPFPDTGPVGVDLNGLDDADADAEDGDDGNDPFPGAPGDGQPRPPRAPDPFPDDDTVQPDAGSDDGSGSDAGAGADDGDTDPGAGGAGASPRQLRTYLQREVANIAGMLGNDDNEGAKSHAITVAETMEKLGGEKAAIPPKDILSAALRQLRKNSPSEISALESDTGAVSAPGQIKLTNWHANNANWAAFAKHYCLGEDDIQASRLIALAVAKDGTSSPKAIGAAKKLAEKVSKDKSAKFKFKNYRHLVAAVFQLMTLKATNDKLLRPLKATDVADTVSVQENA